MASFNLNTDKISGSYREGSESKSTSGQSFFNVLVWVVLGALFSTGVVGVDLWQNRDKSNPPAAHKEVPTALTLEQN